MYGPYAAEAKVVCEEGAGIEQLDQAAVDFGWPMGPITLGDMVGLDLFYKSRKASGDMNKETAVSMGPYELVI